MKFSLQRDLARVSSECVAVRMRIANRAITALYDEALRPHGIKTSQMNLLVAVGRFGEARPAALSRGLCIEKSTLSRNLERMRQSGWVLSATGDDARSVIWRLSAAGKSIFERVLPDWRRAQSQARELLGDTLVDELDQLTERLRNS